jgi:hypothetical protein
VTWAFFFARQERKSDRVTALLARNLESDPFMIEPQKARAPQNSPRSLGQGRGQGRKSQGRLIPATEI